MSGFSFYSKPRCVELENVVSLIPKMALDLSLRRFSLLPRFIQTGNEEPRRDHFVRRGDNSPAGGDQDAGDHRDEPPKQSKTDKYRGLGDITMREVEESLAYFLPQLIPVADVEWVAKNYFCQIPLQKTFEQRPPVVFGRVGSCYPMAGLRENVEELELQFPHKDTVPDLLHIGYGDISRKAAIQSYYVGVKMYLSKKEHREFLQDHDHFLDLGYAPVYEEGFGDLLNMTERDRPSLPWVYVFGSEWFATVSDSWQVDVKHQIEKLLSWNRVGLNFHPRKYLLQYKSLNEEMEFNPGFTDRYVFMPQDIGQTLVKMDEEFSTRFLQGL